MTSQYPHSTLTPAGAPSSSPLRRQHATQPPTLLTTSLNNARNLATGSGLNTPHSTTSLSSSFARQHGGPYTASPVTAASSMPFRNQARYSAPYNPQQWGQIGSEGSPVVGQSSTFSTMHAQQPSRTTAYAPRMAGPDGKSPLNVVQCYRLMVILQSLWFLLPHLTPQKQRRHRQQTQCPLRQTIHMGRHRAALPHFFLRRTCLPVMIVALRIQLKSKTILPPSTVKWVSLRPHHRLVGAEYAPHLEIMPIDYCRQLI